MTLLDHFHPPLSTENSWHSLHNAWCTYLAADLNRRLPEHCFARPNVQFGLEIDVATFARNQPVAPLREVATSPYLAHLAAADAEANPEEPWLPPPPTATLPFAVAPENVAVLVFNNFANPTLVGAIELVSPANKDRAAQRMAFVAKCESYLRLGAGLVVVDIVTGRRANLHDELLLHLEAEQSGLRASDLYAAAYHPVARDGRPSLDIWQEELGVGDPLPTMPLWLRGEGCLAILLQSTYQKTCADLRIISENHA